MRHCCEFKADDTYLLKETSLFVNRKIHIGFCPICQKPVAELVEISFTGSIERTRFSGIKAHNLLMKLRKEIVHSVKDFNYKKFKSKPFGWKYGVNKSGKIKDKGIIRQYAYDFYGNKELIKTITNSLSSS